MEPRFSPANGDTVAVAGRNVSMANVFASASVGMAILDETGLIIETNSSFCEVVGANAEQLVGLSSFALVTEDGREEVQEQFRAAVDDKRNLSSLLRIRKFDGSMVLLEANWSHVRNEPVIVLVVDDVTASLLVQRALEEQARLNRMRADINQTLARAEDQGVVLQDCAQALCESLNMAFVRIWTLDLESQTLILQASAGLYTHLNGPHGRVKIGQFKIGRIAASRNPHLTNDVQNDSEISDPEWAKTEGMRAFAGYPLLLEGEMLGVMAMFSRHVIPQSVLDELAITSDGIAQWVKRKRTEKSLSDLANSLELLVSERTANLMKLNEQLQTFTYTVAHDLRQHIRGINVNSHMLIEEMDLLKGPTREIAERLIYITRLLSKLTDELLSYVRLGSQDPKREWVDVSRLVNEIVADVAKSQQREATLDVSNGLEVLADPSMTRIVFGNLIENCFRYASDRPLHIQVGVDREFLFVSDNGRGFDPKFRHKLFQPMERLQAEVTPGTGMGLAIIRRIAERHGGSVRAEGVLGQGATFFVSFG